MTPVPPIQISPGTPTGQGWPSALTIHTVVLAIGVPMDTRPCATTAGSRRQQVDQTVVSVGPYMFQVSGQRASSSRARSAGSGSAPTSALKPAGGVHCESNRMRHMPGVACRMVVPVRCMCSASALPSVATSRCTICTSAPAASGSISSGTAMSKDSVVTAAQRSVATMPGCARMLSSRFAAARCGTHTPLGLPVEPEV